jgi:lipid II:glycine glycyltransferase (peptidoglycan interpeptide bridge formation enzyme)
MLKIKYKNLITLKWFYKNCSVIDILLPVIYKQFRNKPCKFFIKSDFYTKIIDISKPTEEIFGNFRSTTRNEIKKGERLGMQFSLCKNLDKFREFYNKFAEAKNLKYLNKDSLEIYKNYLLITTISLNGETLVMHAYLLDEDDKRVRLLYSANLFRKEDDKNKRKLIGIANRTLHFYDIKYFKELGFKHYDLGGYAFKTTDPVLKKINYFKDSFGGELVYEPELKSPMFFVIEKLKNLFDNLIK